MLGPGKLEVRTDGGWTVYVPAPIALVGISALLMAGALAAFDPVEVRAAVVDRQVDHLASWQRTESQRRNEAIVAIEDPVRELRRQALLRGIVPGEEDLDACSIADPVAHFRAHAREAARLTSALAERAAAAGSPDAMLPSRSPIDLIGGGDRHIAVDRALPAAIYVSSGKGERADPFTGETKHHKGLDMSAPVGTPVIATADGTVAFAGTIDPNVDHLRSLLGMHVEIRHGETGFTTLYAHLSAIDIAAGAVVRGGQRIGAVGTTGRSTAPHLHYQIMRGGVSVDPLLFIADVVLVRDGESIRYRKTKKESA